MPSVFAVHFLIFILPFKSQTAKINQGNIALKRVVESIANGDSHVPFRDSKLTMLLQVITLHINVSHGRLDYSYEV